MTQSLSTFTQFGRYVLVGLASNLALFSVYLLLTKLGVEHKVAMTLLYATGIALTFVSNRGWSFEHQGRLSGALVRYILTYLLGYVLNLVVLLLVVDNWGWPHQYVQGCMTLCLAVMLFLLQKFWVFAERVPA